MSRQIIWVLEHMGYRAILSIAVRAQLLCSYDSNRGSSQPCYTTACFNSALFSASRADSISMGKSFGLNFSVTFYFQNFVLASISLLCFPI